MRPPQGPHGSSLLLHVPCRPWLGSGWGLHLHPPRGSSTLLRNLEPHLSPSLLSSRPPANQAVSIASAEVSAEPPQPLSPSQLSRPHFTCSDQNPRNPPSLFPPHSTSINKSCGLHPEDILCTRPVLPHPCHHPGPSTSLKSSLVSLLPRALFSPQLPSDPCKM